MDFYFNLAYDATRWNKDNLDEYLLLWAAREYGEKVAEQTASVFSRYMKVSWLHLLRDRAPLTFDKSLQYVSRQKPELNSPTTYSLVCELSSSPSSTSDSQLTSARSLLSLPRVSEASVSIA